MTKIAAIFEDGIFRPDQPVSLKNGTRVEVIVQDAPATDDPAEAARWIKELAALEPESPNDGFSGTDHDQVLYGAPATRDKAGGER
jgi:predicted DNA-binding antitoxin AbrB/MazE fold protein